MALKTTRELIIDAKRFEDNCERGLCELSEAQYMLRQLTERLEVLEPVEAELRKVAGADDPLGQRDVLGFLARGLAAVEGF